MLNTRDLWGETFASMRRIVGVLRHPRSTMAAVVAAPSWLAAWVIVLLLWLVPGGWLLSTPVGRQALVDERVRRIEAFGGSIDDAEYGALRQSPPLAAYFTSGGRPLLAPAVTLAVAAGCGSWPGSTGRPSRGFRARSQRARLGGAGDTAARRRAPALST